MANLAVKDAAGTTVYVSKTGAGSDVDPYVDPASTALGGTSDAATTAGGTGSLSSKLRLATSQLDTIVTTVGAVAKESGGNLAGAATSLAIMDDWDSTDACKSVGFATTPSANFTRPADTTAYASGDLVANSTTAGSVAALSFTATRIATGSCLIRRARLKKSGTAITNASFRLHLYGSDPAASSGITNGDNGAWLTKHASYLGAIDITVGTAFSDAAAGNGVPNFGSEITASLASGSTVYGLLEARAAYTPASSEVFTCELEVLQN